MTLLSIQYDDSLTKENGTKREQITHQDLLDKIRYNSKTGIFYNRQTGQRIGHYDASNNTRAILINGKKYQETRLAVFYVTGQWPKGFVKNKSACKTVTKFKDLIFKLQDENNTQEIEEEIFNNEYGIFKRFWRWLNG